jgi:hypothetical protein
MKWLEGKMSTIAALLSAMAVFAVSAQALYKYVDKDGKVTYSDRAPKPGEKAELVTIDSKQNVMSDNNRPAVQTNANSRLAEQRAQQRDKLQADIDAARDELARAKQALEQGREPTADERQIVVGRGKDGKPTGANSIVLKQDYYDRIAALEDAVKVAQEKVDKAESSYRRGAPN